MTLRYGSVCSGIEAASAAWHPLGWTPEFFAEIERFPSEVLAHHYGSNLPGEPWSGNAPPNLGDMTRFQEWPDAVLDVLVGGTPCQSFSVAGLRKGLADPRGNLALTYLALADRYRPRWVVWENVPGVLSSNGGRDFGAFLGGLAELGYGWAYRVLDAQHVRVDGFGRAVPQRRRRVFVVGCAGDWRRAGAVLFERESLSGHPAPRREAREGVAPTLSARPTGGGGLGTDFDLDGGLIPEVAGTMKSCRESGGWTNSVDHAAAGYMLPVAFGGGNTSGAIDAAACLTAKGQRVDFEVKTFVTTHSVADTLTSNGDAHSGFRLDAGLVAHTLRAEGFDASEDGTGRGIPLVPFDTTQITSAANRSVPKDGDPCHPLAAGAHAPAIAIQAGALRENPDSGPDGVGVQEGISYTLEARAEVQAVASGWAVRRLTPTECERLQGFPDGYTAITRNGKPAADGPRYKALGNSMAVNVMRWIGRRIEAVEKMEVELAKDVAA